MEQTKRGIWFIRPRVEKIGEDGLPKRVRETITIGAMGKREATTKMREIMATINQSDYVIKSQIPVRELLDRWETLHVSEQSASTQGKYKSHLKVHIRPAFAEMQLYEFGDSLKLKHWLDARKLGWHARNDLRNILSSIFTKAIEWKIWTETNPMELVHVGRKTVVYERRKLTDEEMRQFLAALPYHVRIACSIALFCTLRVSEVLGLQEKHIDFEKNLILVRQRFYRGDLDQPKNYNAKRDVPMGYLATDLKRLCQGDPERFVFRIDLPRKAGLCQDDRDLRRYYLKPAAKKAGCYFKGFGFHSLRREAITAVHAALNPAQALRMSGHGNIEMGLLYTLAEYEAQERAVRERQEKILGVVPEGKAN